MEPTTPQWQRSRRRRRRLLLLPGRRQPEQHAVAQWEEQRNRHGAAGDLHHSLDLKHPPDRPQALVAPTPAGLLRREERRLVKVRQQAKQATPPKLQIVKRSPVERTQMVSQLVHQSQPGKRRPRWRENVPYRLQPLKSQLKYQILTRRLSVILMKRLYLFVMMRRLSFVLMRRLSLVLMRRQSLVLMRRQSLVLMRRQSLVPRR